MTIADAFRWLFRRRAKPPPPVPDLLPDVGDVISSIFAKECRNQGQHMARTKRIVDDLLNIGTVNGISCLSFNRRK